MYRHGLSTSTYRVCAKKLLSYSSKIVNRTGFGYGFMD